MLIRIVRLTLTPERLPDFLALFERVSPAIRAIEGCEHLELLQDMTHPNIVSTYSRWTSEAALENYRQSEFFKKTWKETKTLFAAPPSAHSYRIMGHGG